MKNKHIPQQIDGVDCGVFMLMYALHLVLGAPFDFKSCDFPNIQRWWTLVLPENFGAFFFTGHFLQPTITFAPLLINFKLNKICILQCRIPTRFPSKWRTSYALQQ